MILDGVGHMPAKKKAEEKKEEVSLKDQIISELNPKMESAFNEMKKDLLADIKEEIKKTKSIQEHKPEQATPSTIPNMDVGTIMKSLTGSNGEIDIKKLTGLMEASKPPVDPSQMNEQQMKFYQQERNDRLLLQILPQILGSFNQQNPMTPLFMEMMQRNFLASVADADAQRRMVQQAMMKRIGGEMADLNLDTGAMSPVHAANAALGVTPLGGMGKPQPQQPQSGGAPVGRQPS